VSGDQKADINKAVKSTIHLARLSGLDRLPASIQTGKPKSTAGKTLEAVQEQVMGCTKCDISSKIRNYVFGECSPQAPIMFIGEAPGAEEDIQGRPFVGQAGQLLTDIITKGMKLKRSDVFIANILKCRPPGNRNPEPHEIDNCIGYLHAQIELIDPRVIVALGKFASQTLLNSSVSISKLRGTFQEYRGIPLMPTFHPAYLLRNPSGKKKVWEDIKKVMAHLGLPLPGE
jgi:DNA polymerase